MAVTEKAFPFASQANSESDWSALVGTLAETGVLSGLAITAGSGMQVLLATGSAFVQGFLYQATGTGTKALTVAAAPATVGQTRLDAVILKLDLAADSITASVKSGTANSSGGVLPALQQDATVWEFQIGTITVANGTTNIVTGMISQQLTGTGLRVIPYTSQAVRPTPTAPRALGLNLTTKAVEFWNGSSWSAIAADYASLLNVPASFAPAAHSLDSHSGTLSVAKGGTGATDAAAALTALGGVPASDVSGFTGGTLDSARLPVVPVAKGGTGKTTASDALTALGVLVRSTAIVSGDGLPAGTLRFW